MAQESVSTREGERKSAEQHRTMEPNRPKNKKKDYWSRGRALFRAHKLDLGLSPIPWRKGLDSGKKRDRKGRHAGSGAYAEQRARGDRCAQEAHAQNLEAAANVLGVDLVDQVRQLHKDQLLNNAQLALVILINGASDEARYLLRT